MKKLFSGIITAVIIGGILVSANFYTRQPVAYAGTTTAPQTTNKGKITVNGQGSVAVKPDIAYLNLGVQTDDVDASKAQASNSNSINTIIKLLKDLGVAEKDIQTQNYSVYPKYDYSKVDPNTQNKIIGYTVNNSVRVTVRDLTKVGTILDKAVASGANSNGGIQFSISDTKKYYEEALSQAIVDAQGKGTVIAKTLSKSISAPVEVIEQSSYSPTPVYYMAEAAKMSTADTRVPVQEGQLTVSASVQVIYEY